MTPAQAAAAQGKRVVYRPPGTPGEAGVIHSTTGAAALVVFDGTVRAVDPVYLTFAALPKWLREG